MDTDAEGSAAAAVDVGLSVLVERKRAVERDVERVLLRRVLENMMT